MEQTIKIATNLVKADLVEKTIDFPEVPMYYAYDDCGNFFPKGLILFAIIPIHGTYYRLVKVQRNTQSSTDFSVVKDCRDSAWITLQSDDMSLRRMALGLITGELGEYMDISEEHFYTERERLLNHFRNW